MARVEAKVQFGEHAPETHTIPLEATIWLTNEELADLHQKLDLERLMPQFSVKRQRVGIYFADRISEILAHELQLPASSCRVTIKGVPTRLKS